MPIQVKELAKPRLAPAAEKVKKILDASPTDEVYPTKEMVVRAGVSISTLLGLLDSSDAFQVYHLGRRGKKAYWGNPKAITAARKQLEAQ